MQNHTYELRQRCSPSIKLPAFYCVATLFWFAGSVDCNAQEAYAADPPMPAYVLPEVLRLRDGTPVTTTEQWKSARRSEILELFRTNVYGRVPTTRYEQSFHVAHEDRNALAVGSASEDRWADPRGEFLSVVQAAPVFALFGHKALGTAEMAGIGSAVHGDQAHYHLRAGKHNLTLEDWKHYWDFGDRVFARQSTPKASP